MSKLIIICEGQSEQAFCDRLLKPHFNELGIEIEYPLILHSNGGIVPWPILKKQVELHHTADPEAFITTFIDFYGLNDKLSFPQWNASRMLTMDRRPEAMDLLEAGMKGDVDDALAQRFIPYIQLHEFEALVLSDEAAFLAYYDTAEYDAIGVARLCAQEPESVNSGFDSAPSKRLEKLIPRYNKVADGVELALLAGLDRIRARCPRFDAWIGALERLQGAGPV